MRLCEAISEENTYNELPDVYAIVSAELTKVVGEYPVNNKYTKTSDHTRYCEAATR